MSDRRVLLHVEILDVEPPVWRDIDVDSGITLSQLHTVLQVAFGWRESHLHAFTEDDPRTPASAESPGLARIGRQPLRWTADGPDDEIAPAEPEATTTVASALNAVSAGRLYYEYDVGDGWVHSIEERPNHSPMHDGPVFARLHSGEGRAPFENSGGPQGYMDILARLETGRVPADLRGFLRYSVGPWTETDADAFDLNGTDAELTLLDERSLQESALEPWFERMFGEASVLGEVLPRMAEPLQREVRELLFRSDEGRVRPTSGLAIAGAMSPLSWLVARMGADGVGLTKSGYLPPAFVEDAMTELGRLDEWPGRNFREDLTWPVLSLRSAAQRLGLVRKLKGRLVITEAARRTFSDPAALWAHTATKLPAVGKRLERDATALLAIELATGCRHGMRRSLEAVAYGLEALGYVRQDERPLEHTDAARALQNTLDALRSFGITSTANPDAVAGPTAIAFGWAMLWGPDPSQRRS